MWNWPEIFGQENLDLNLCEAIYSFDLSQSVWIFICFAAEVLMDLITHQ